MAIGKWIGGWFGWISSGSVLGALAGFAIGSFFDAFAERSQQREESRFSEQEEEEPKDGRNDFLFSLMVLSAHVIQADGKIMHSEMELLRQFLRNSFGVQAAKEGNEIILKLFEYRKQRGEGEWQRNIAEACREMTLHMSHENRLQLLAFLCGIAKADGRVDEKEVQVLHSIATLLSISPEAVSQMLHLDGESLDDAYAVLGIRKEATDEEVRKAYRQMAIKHHPDRVATLGEDVKAAATKKFQQINDAKERIFKARGMK